MKISTFYDIYYKHRFIKSNVFLKIYLSLIFPWKYFIYNEKPTLRQILNCVINKQDFFSKYIKNSDKEYFLKNFNSIEIFKGRINEIAFINKK